MHVEAPHGGLSLNEAEQLYKIYDLSYAFTEKFGYGSDSEIILGYKKELSGIITEILKKSGLPFRTCRICGKKLRWNFPYGICARCYDESHRRRRHRWKEFY
jgi:ATP-dependent RNA helicase SUPV3L1/SUV3